MFDLTDSQEFLLYRYPVDMRKSFDGLCYLVVSHSDYNPFDQKVYIFINKSKTLMKLLQWQDGGFMLYYKRLERGSFGLDQFKSKTSIEKISYWDLVSLLTGVSSVKTKQRKRFTKPYKTINY